MSEKYRYIWNFDKGVAIDTKGEEKTVFLTHISAGYACIYSNGTKIAELGFEDGNVVNFLRKLTEIINNRFKGTKTLAAWEGESEQSTKRNLEKFKNSLNGLGLLKGSYFEFNKKKEPQSSKNSSMNSSDNQKNAAKGGAQAMIDEAIQAAKKSIKKCVIFTGAPGTGKTYCVEKFVDEAMKGSGFDRKEYFVQFHSSYDYTDFVEGLRPLQKGRQMAFVRMDGIFKAFCRKVVALNGKNKEDGSSGKTPLEGGAKKIEAVEEDSPKHGEKEMEAAKEDIPKSDDTGDGAVGENPPKISDETPYYYFVIDEINRADLGRVFGELMYCFEKRGDERKIATQYANLPAYGKDGKLIKKDCFKNGFYIPDNVVIIGTMNDIDRSVETFDFALRRRFDWVEIEADAVMESSLTSMGVPTDIVSRIKAAEDKKARDGLNGIIEKQSGLGKEFKIGPAYFRGYDGTEEKLEEIWQRNIAPILREYIRGRQGTDGFIKKCRAALFLEEGTQNGTEPVETQEGSGGNKNTQQGE